MLEISSLARGNSSKYGWNDDQRNRTQRLTHRRLLSSYSKQKNDRHVSPISWIVTYSLIDSSLRIKSVAVLEWYVDDGFNLKVPFQMYTHKKTLWMQPFSYILFYFCCFKHHYGGIIFSSGCISSHHCRRQFLSLIRWYCKDLFGKDILRIHEPDQKRNSFGYCTL